MSVDGNSAECLFLHALFEKLLSKNVEYCVLRNHEDLPHSAGGGDIDIAVSLDHRDRIADIIIKLAEKYGGEAIVDYVGSGRFIRILGCYGGSWWGVAIDLFDRVEYKGIEYISTSRLIQGSWNHGVIKVADEEQSLVIALVKELLSNGKSRKDYLPKVQDLWQRKGLESIGILCDFISPKTEEIMGKVLSTSEHRLGELVIALRGDVLARGAFKNRLINLWKRVSRLWQTPGISIAVLGTDGAGKTTLIESIRPIIERSLHSSIHYEHLRPNWIPRLGSVAGKTESSGVVDNPHGQKPSGFLGSCARVAYYALDYYLGYWIKVHPKIAKEAKVVLFDRYFYDFILDPRRMRISLPNWLIKLVMAFAPQPNLILCLGADPDLIYARKPETSLEEVTRQVTQLRQFCDNRKQAIWVDTGVELSESSSSALSALKRIMNLRIS